MYSFDYNTRNFGTSCDRGFQGLSSYHLSQKFGHLGTKLQPVERNIVADLIDGEDVEEIKKDERLFYKKIFKYNQMSVLALIKSFEIDWIKDKDSQVNRKLSKCLILNFQTTLQILNTHKDFIDFFMKNLQLLELNTVALKQKGLHQLRSKVDKFQNEEFPAPYLIVSNQSGQGYFKIHFPKIEIYFQEYCQFKEFLIIFLLYFITAKLINQFLMQYLALGIGLLTQHIYDLIQIIYQNKILLNNID